MQLSQESVMCLLVGFVLAASTVSAQDNVSAKNVSAKNVAAKNVVANGSFELEGESNGQPDGWATSGVVGLEQTLTTDVDDRGTKVARLTCSKFVGGSPASHAMVCQNGHVAVKAGQWYR